MRKIPGKDIVKEDMQELMRRLNERMEGALRIFSQKRSRDHFKQIFFNRYKEFSIEVLKDLDESLYSNIVSYYEAVDDLYWYFMSTEDMPSLVESNVQSIMKRLNHKYGQTAELFLDLKDHHNFEIDALDSEVNGEGVLPDGDNDSPPPFSDVNTSDEDN